MNNIELFYNIENKLLDKKKPWYSTKGILYIPATYTIFGKYFLEVYSYDAQGIRHNHIILSNIKINKNCRTAQIDNYGRIKIKLQSFKYMFESYKKDSNVKLKIVDSTNNYIVYNIDGDLDNNG